MENKHNNIEELRDVAPAVANLGNYNLYSVPFGYFDSLPDSILCLIKLTEIRLLDPYSVPNNYFEKLSIPAIEKSASKVISFGNNISKWVTHAAAASVLFIVAATTYLYVTVHNRNSEKSLTIEQKLARLNDQEIINYLKEN